MRIIERLKPAWAWISGSASYPEIEALEHEIRKRDLELEQLRNLLHTSHEWKEAVHSALVVNWAIRPEHEHDARKAVRDLIAQEVWLALDPEVSLEAKALVERGAARATQSGELG